MSKMRHPPHQTSTTPDIHHARHPPHQTSTTPGPHIVWWMSYFTHGVVDVWCGESPFLATVWWMSIVVDVCAVDVVQSKYLFTLFKTPKKQYIFFYGYGKRRCSSTFFWCACPLKTLIRNYFFCFGNGGERMSKGAQASHGTLSWLAGVTPSDLRLNRWGTIFSLRDRQTRHQFFKKDKSRFGL